MVGAVSSKLPMTVSLIPALAVVQCISLYNRVINAVMNNIASDREDHAQESQTDQIKREIVWLQTAQPECVAQTFRSFSRS